jgi:hypothetical protein
MRHHRHAVAGNLVAEARSAARTLFMTAAVMGAVAISHPAEASAQEAAVIAAAAVTPVIRYAANESGGRITISSPAADSGVIEAIRVHLLENAAAIRRGEFRTVRVIQTDHPAVQILADRRDAVRCTFRITPRGGELVLLSADDAVVAAIHQLLRSVPPRMTTL